ncbi:hypothetical protein [Hyphomonas sp.]|uniref:hypothetical protein n=1 Tax=Hyphomonas sp. TaxID=87 RepID=UPI001DBBF734|nr:hypothetical protein [Hyphomonas sp.]
MNGKHVSLVILGIVAVLCLAYAGYQFFRGEPDDALPLVIAAVVCGALITVLGRTSQK